MALSDMMKHWQSIKAQYDDCIIFYRLGDFYEMFFDDAIESSKILDLTLTGRDCGLPERAPMCGIPYHAAEVYLSKLVSAGKKVAICEQLTEPGAQKGLVERDVIKVVTSGTVTADAQLDEKTNNFIASVYTSNNCYGIAWADITTGEFLTEQIELNDEKLVDVLIRINPSEIIADQSAYNLSLSLIAVQKALLPPFSLLSENMTLSVATDILLSQFNAKSLTAFLPEDKNVSIFASAMLIKYLKLTQKHLLKNISGVEYYDDGSCLILDSTALRNLEVVQSMRDGKTYGSLLWAIDNTSTAMGARKLRSVLVYPLRSLEKINYRLDGVSNLYEDNQLRDGLRDILKGLKDFERLSGKISNDIITPRDTLAVLQCLDAVIPLKMLLVGVKSQILNDISNALGEYSELVKFLSSVISDEPPLTIKDCGFVKDGYDEELDRLRNMRFNSGKFITELEANEREKTGIKNLKVGYNRVFGYYIEITNSFKNLVPYNYVRKQTLVGSERYITEELKKFEEEILSCDDKIARIERDIFIKVKQILLDNLSSFIKTARAFAMLDVLCSFSLTAKKNRYTRPIVTDSDDKLEIIGGRHPVVEAVSKEQFIANDTFMNNSSDRTMIITGPNMAGKSTYMRQVAILVLLAQCGSFIPVKSATIPVCDKIYTRVGASDNLIFDQSTFMVEMTEVAKIIRNSTKNSLLILDEVGRGTSTYDGLSIAWAVVEYITENIKAKTLFATHYHELSELETLISGVKNYKITVKELNGTIVFLRKIMRGSANKSFGIEVASLAGVPDTVNQRAKIILKRLEKNDLVANFSSNKVQIETDDKKELSKIEEYIKNIDINNISPMKAFELLVDLKDKVDNGNN